MDKYKGLERNAGRRREKDKGKKGMKEKKRLGKG
jgi:hypothetical protein